MKKGLLILLVVTLVTAGSFTTLAQGVFKFGHINSQELLSTLPERESAEKEIEEYANKLETQQKSMQDELNSKYEEYLAQRDSYTDLVKATKEKDLQDIQQRIATFNQVAMQDLQKKEGELIKPIIEKVQKAIEEVGKENGYTYIFDLSNRTVVYVSDQSEDVTLLVKKKLGLIQP